MLICLQYLMLLFYQPIVQDENLKKKAFEITSSLSFSLPVPKFINYLNKSPSDTSQSNFHQSPTEILFTPMEQRTTKTELIVSSSSKGKEREMEPVRKSSIKGKEREIVEVSKSSKKRRMNDIDEDGVEETEPATIIDESSSSLKDDTNKRITPTRLTKNINNNKAKQGIVAVTS
ncbi:hypothetical protein C1645_402536 [Glomus cerebriforme]|uniref:Uncharacterized protein n=1 Tax=Glomus cerebriforme TaxID=658196 RepID=A0A397SFG5_9GLOM|nr:hypothetical protein C1645_402536 [Glomus cerebriforme]